MAPRLPHYLRTYRRQAGFSQDELAYLLGLERATRVSRYEQFDREPVLKTVLAYLIVFRAPPEQLFAGIYSEVARGVRERATTLAGRLEAHPPNASRRQKLDALRTITKPTT